MSGLERAIEIALDAHRGMRDKGGQPYILHPLRLMLQMRSENEQLAALLHDVVEDSDWTLERLRAEGFAEVVIEAVDALTRRENESYEDFVRRASTVPIARVVKVADLRDNLDISRIPEPTARDHRRVDKYKRALALLDD